ncbi:MAG: hypothetical protein OXS40_07435 [Gammaproteobacteria bacterium]|nr:hypothetical protein [Gammaproteobacteria bacterium]
MKPLVYIMAALGLALALTLPPSVFESANVDHELSTVAPLPPEPAVHAVTEMPEQEHDAELAAQEMPGQEHQPKLPAQEMTGQEHQPELAAQEVTEQALIPVPAGQEVTGQEPLPVYAGKAMTGQEYMLEHARVAQQTNGCFDVMMGMGCRIQSQIPVWNQFAAVFASHFGITCPVGTATLQL